MLFLPYRMDSEKMSIPFFTILICLVCVAVYWNQYQQDNEHFQAVERFCYQSLDDKSVAFLRDIVNEDHGNYCSEIFGAIRDAEDPLAKLTEYAKDARVIGLFANTNDEFDYYYARLQELYKRFDSAVPDSLTDNLVYDPNNLDIVKMVTSTFSHADIYHLIGNLLFFYIFSASIELVMGSIVYLFNIAVATIVTSLAYSYSVSGVENALPTLGLSGVVMFSLAALGVMLPTARIKCFFWFIVFFKVFRLPAIILTLWYVGWDIYNMYTLGDSSNINYVAHVSGAVLGIIVGVYYLLFKNERLHEVSMRV